MEAEQAGTQETGWQDTGSDDFVDAWDETADDDSDVFDEYHDDEDEAEALLAAPAAASGAAVTQAAGTQPVHTEQPTAAAFVQNQALEHLQLQQDDPQELQQHMETHAAEQEDVLEQLLLQMHPRDMQRLLRRLHGRHLAAAAPHTPVLGQGDVDAEPGDGEGGVAGLSLSGSGTADGSSMSGGSLSDDDDEASEGDEQAAGCVRFDPNVAARHQYLGDVDELEGSYGLLPEGTTARLPLLVLDGVVLFPGCQLPLLLSTPHELHLLDRALSAPQPLTRLLAVLPGPRSLLRSLPSAVCCTAEVRQMRRQGDDERSVAVLALGRQRAEVVADGRTCAHSQVSVNVRILSEGCSSDVPPLMRQGYSAIHPALTRPWDLQLLVGRVRHLLELVLLPAASFQGSPLELSYYVSHNLPLPPSTRQMLLMCSCPAERLRLLLELLQRLDRLCCSACGTQLATTAEVLAMTTEGIGATYVNTHGYVHEMVTFSKVHGLRLYGAPETAHSWFPGYAWTIAHCGTCGQHMGWRFTATSPSLMPRAFWGIRRPGLLCATAPNSNHDHDHDHGSGGAGQAGLPGAAAGGVVRDAADGGGGVHWMDLLLGRVRQARVVLQLRQQPGGDGAATGAGEG